MLKEEEEPGNFVTGAYEGVKGKNMFIQVVEWKCLKE